MHIRITRLLGHACSAYGCVEFAGISRSGGVEIKQAGSG
jgi:hypothetical protein